MKRIVLFITLMFAATFAQAQINEVTLMVNGEGTTKNEATTLALRSAIEQTFGTFVSANTEILNDEIVKDEIATVASGNIKSYKEISSVKTDDGYNVTVEAVVSVGKLIEYSKSHGSSAEFAGKTFAMQMKLEQLNIDNEKKALHDMIRQLYLLLPDVFDYSIEVDNPVMTSAEECTLNCVVSLNTNASTKSFYDVINKYFQGLSIDKDLNTPNKYRVLFDDKEYYLRTNEWMLDMNCLFKRGLFPKILDFEVLGKTGENKQKKFYFCESFHYSDNISVRGRLPDKYDYGWFSFHYYEFLNKIDGTSVEQMDLNRYDNRILRIGSQHLHFPRIFPEEPNKVPAIYIDDDKMKSIYLFPFANPYNNKTIYQVELQLKLKNTVLENLEEIVVRSKHESRILKPALINEDNISDPTPLPNKSKDLTYEVLFKLFKTKIKDELYQGYGRFPSEGSKYKNYSFQIGLYVYDDGHLSMDKSCLPEFLTSQNTDEIYLWYHDGRFIKKRKIDDADGQMKSWMQYVLKRFEEFVSTIRVTPCEINGVVQDKFLIGFGHDYGEFKPFDF